MNRYIQIITDLDREIARLTGMIQRFQARGVRLERIPAIREQIAALTVSRAKARANALWATELGWVA